MLAAQDDEQLDKLLWGECAQEIKPYEQVGSLHSASEAGDAQMMDMSDLPKHIKMLLSSDFMPDEKSPINVKDQGVLSLKSGSIIQKKFKYFREPDDKDEPLHVISSMPSVIQVRTPLIQPDLADAQGRVFAFVKFQVQAPATECEMEGRILIVGANNEPEELILFDLDIN